VLLVSRPRSQQLLCDAFQIQFPYVKMGNIDSLHLFGLDTEMAIFAMYHHNTYRWSNVLDIGANLGLHSILLDKLGYNVRAYEPDFEHFSHLLDNLAQNSCSRVQPFMAAVHTSSGTGRFVRVHNNLTGNHLEGFKNSYGPRDTVLVPTVDCRTLWPGTDFAKIDSEGNEAELCSTMTAETMKHMDVVMEVRNGDNAGFIYRHFNSINVPMWSQKTDWEQVKRFEDMPHVNRQGSLFVGARGPWE
jgi:FkbM family methyltransferase